MITAKEFYAAAEALRDKISEEEMLMLLFLVRM